jgi:sterol desaturase/sphingolipid hydroxylase (fatty acid hydroxylase superfamily)
MSNYETIVHPHDKSPKLFNNKILEYLTKTHPFIIDGMYILIAFLMIRHYIIAIEHPGWMYILGLFLLGYFSWTFAEYILHRFLYHKIKDASYSSGLQYVFHGIHHEYPNDKERLVLPPIPSLIIAALFFGLFYLMMGNNSFLFSPGFMIGYCSYMSIHFMVHKVKPPKNFHFWWTHHNIHHYQQHDRAFGVSISLWDRVFKTMPEPNRRTIDIKIEKSHHEVRNN